ncbi:uncharacterized protein LOC129654326 [Bubalus kerabau]|uniref:uncharacterized protein LOC129654326 n=1 Tax=Bubalus carabanensis TaxID=3119969 RepID=UPI00244E6CCA|nr:uncharacterized protein LOC129654326 [Bubalus carabanensis]
MPKTEQRTQVSGQSGMPQVQTAVLRGVWPTVTRCLGLGFYPQVDSLNQVDSAFDSLIQTSRKGTIMTAPALDSFPPSLRRVITVCSPRGGEPDIPVESPRLSFRSAGRGSRDIPCVGGGAQTSTSPPGTLCSAAPRPSRDRPSGRWNLPSGSGGLPSRRTDRPSGHTDRPSGHWNLPSWLTDRRPGAGTAHPAREPPPRVRGPPLRALEPPLRPGAAPPGSRSSPPGAGTGPGAEAPPFSLPTGPARPSPRPRHGPATPPSPRPPRYHSGHLVSLGIVASGNRAQSSVGLGSAFPLVSPKVTEAFVSRKPSPWSPRESPFFWCLVGMLLVILVLLLPSVSEKSCPNLGDPANGQVNFVNESVLFGSQAHFACNPGFYLIGAKIIYCEISGDNVNWSDNLPICEIILCAAPGNITNGRFTQYKEVYQYSEVVIYRCNPSNGPDEYSLIGETTLICVDHNRWSSDPPECKVVKCDYPIVEHGAIVSGFRGKYYYNMQVVFQCRDGFYLHGSSTIVCGAKGTWEPELPKCSAKEAIATTTVSATSNASGPQTTTAPESSPTDSVPLYLANIV